MTLNGAQLMATIGYKVCTLICIAVLSQNRRRRT